MYESVIRSNITYSRDETITDKAKLIQITEIVEIAKLTNIVEHKSSII